MCACPWPQEQKKKKRLAWIGLNCVHISEAFSGYCIKSLSTSETNVLCTADAGFLLCRVGSTLFTFCVYMWGYSEKISFKESYFACYFLENTFSMSIFISSIGHKNVLNTSLTTRAC